MEEGFSNHTTTAPLHQDLKPSLSPNDQTSVIYDTTRFYKFKVESWYSHYYARWGIIIEKGVMMDDIANRPSIIHNLFQFQGWEPMLLDLRPVAKVQVWEFYVNIHHKHRNSFWTWV
jgi:hypothetical protein